MYNITYKLLIIVMKSHIFIESVLHVKLTTATINLVNRCRTHKRIISLVCDANDQTEASHILIFSSLMFGNMFDP